MSKNKVVAIVIPIYKESFSDMEKISLKQVLKILNRYDIYGISPDDFSGNVPSDITIKKFPDYYFKSIAAYNRLMLDISLYESFQDYEYILIYQLDAFVFEDRLLYFCSQGYDYIGAPWLYGLYYYTNNKRCVWRVGNGGLSLRKNESFIKLLRRGGIFSSSNLNEDFLFSISDSDSFRVAPLDVALQFSFEQQVEKCFEKNNQKLPFGCHAWQRYNLDFWKPYIEGFGYEIKNDFYNPGNEDKILEEMYDEREKKSFFWEHIYSKEKMKEILDSLFIKQFDSCIIWGAGYYGKEICKIFDDAGIRIRCIIDNNPTTWGQYIGNYKIESMASSGMSKRMVIIVALKNHAGEVAEQLEAEGYAYRSDYIFLKDLEDKMFGDLL